MENNSILILSANTGEGHNSAARAISEKLNALGIRCRMMDGLSFLPQPANALICRSHIFLYRRLPKLYGAGYHLGEILSRRACVSSGRMTRGKLRLLKLIKEENFRAIICTHVFAAKLVSDLRMAGKIDLPCFFLATDYSCSPGVNHLDMDAWLIPHKKLTSEFAARGIPEAKLIAAGIPVQEEFEQKCGQEALRRKLSLPTDKKIVVLSSGSMGAGRLEKLVPDLLKQLPGDAILAVVCSRNHRLAQRLRRIHSEKLLVFGFVEKLSDYLEAADLYLTKPGGLSTTEAMHKGVPVLLFNAVPGVETRNLEFLTGIGCAEAANTGDLAGRIGELLSDMRRSDALVGNCKMNFPGGAAERICKVLLKKKELSN